MTMQDKIREVEERRRAKSQGGGPAEVDRQHRLGKLTARERLARLFDPGTFQELNLWIQPIRTGFDIDRRELPGDAVIAGFGKVHGRPVYAYIHDFTVLGGAQSLGQNHKVTAVMEKARATGVPYVGMIDSGGVKVHDRFGRPAYRPVIGGIGMAFTSGVFPAVVLDSGVVPQVSLMLGPCYAGAAYSPIMADFVVMRRGTSYMSLASPQLLKSATFVDVTQEEIGGAEMHATVTGSADFLVDSDEEAIETARTLLTYLPANSKEKSPVVGTADPPERREEKLLEVVPADLSRPYDMHEVISLVVDGGQFLELQARFAPNMIIGFGRLAGRTVGIVANNPAEKQGAIDINACDKEARFIRFCDAFNIPLVFLVDTPGFVSSEEEERSREGRVRNAAKPVFAICEATVPKITVCIGRSSGPGRLAMGTPREGMDLVLSWPSAQVARLDPKEVVETIWKEEIAESPHPEEVRRNRLEELLKTYIKFPFHAAEYLMVDDIIDPRDTRPHLIRALDMLANKPPEPRPWKKHSLIPR
ncbi:MAG: acyl-CoA carboxylase subunit beta [Chloroflexi bacterium]|nr:acyl-CoA carboxylase subunit beta [Chloroflexota bacterium]